MILGEARTGPCAAARVELNGTETGGITALVKYRPELFSVQL